MQNRIASIQMTSTNDVAENLDVAKKLIEDAVAENAKLIVLPEMFAIMAMDQQVKLSVREQLGDGPIQNFLKEQAKIHGVWIVGGTIPIISSHDKNKIRASCLVVNDRGETVANYEKIHLFDVSLPATKESYAESNIIEPGNKVVVIPTPFGKLGLAVCYDVRFPELFRKMHEQEVEIIALPSAFTFTTGSAHWDVLIKARAIENLCYVVSACQVGTHPGGRKTYGHSMIVNPWGDVKASLNQGVGFIVADINLDYMHQVRRDFPVLTHRKLLT